MLKETTTTRPQGGNDPSSKDSDINTYEKDASRHFTTYLVTGTLIHIAGYLYASGMIGKLTLYTTLLCLVPRMLISVHETFHYVPSSGLDFFLRYMIFLPEMYVDYDRWRDEHIAHHINMATPNDPNYFILSGTPLEGFLKSFIDPERRLYILLTESFKSVDAKLVMRWILGLMFCQAEMYLFGGAQVWLTSFYIPYRVVNGLSIFILFYFVHNDTVLSFSPVMGVYNIDLSPSLRKVACLLLGAEVVDAVTHHAAHHTVGQWKVRSDKLSEHSTAGPYKMKD